MNLFKIDMVTLAKKQLTFGGHNFFTHPSINHTKR
ncbi:hypothetical protein SAMN05421740_102748 [Parapedobacter koreensis]|uniref:Uncharacterized protein n=1 Tax=Parapedobacter koreensis TaxID=332977 RepID=A0A1H7K1F9_9SPHI|nr:hypothetical protein SAMN05421740_102748 [Parapedobacter koreensis]